MNHSESLANIGAALSKAQAAVKIAVKDSVNPHLKSKYADLGSVFDACRDALAENGLSVVQMPVSDEPGYIALETMLLHASGEFISSRARVRLQKDDPQGAGSGLTYLRRYSLSAALGVVSDDDDGHAASAPRGQQKGQQTPPRPQSAPATPRPAQGDSEAIGEELAQRLHTQLGAMLKGTAHAGMTHAAWATTITGRTVEHLRDLTRAESKAVYNAAKAEQEQSAA